MRPHPLRPVAPFVCAIAALSALHACVERPIEATVNVAPAATTTRCVKVVVWPKTDRTEASSLPLDLDSGTPFVVAVFRSDLEKSISLVARGYDDPACARINEESPTVYATFGTDRQVTLNLSGSPCTTSPAGTPCAGGTCRSDQMCVDAGSEFSCTNGLDDNSNGRTDCMDCDCTDVACATTNLCIASPTCQVDGGCGGARTVCDAPPSACYNPLGTCNGLDGGCIYTVNTSNSCNDGNACTLNDLCQVNGSCTGTPKVCNTPPGQCYGAVGTCNTSDGTCNYSVTAAAGCDDSNACTTTDQCQANGSCQGAALPCNTPPPTGCYDAVGTCASGLCNYTVNVTKSCVDSNPCTAGETCQANGSCAMTQLNGPWCGVLGDAGICQAGTCVPFPYRPSNFDVAIIADAGASAAVTINCNAWFNTTDGGSLWCAGQPSPIVSVIPQTSGPEAVVLSMMSLDLQATRSLTIYGSRPAILAVWGNATITGVLSVRSIIGADAGAGDIPQDPGCNAGAGAANTSMGSSRGGSGGGGGGFGTNGANGGQGNGQTAGSRGSMNGNATNVPLRGGCNGGQGGRAGDPGQVGGMGGAGGGGIQLSVAGTLTITGTVTASGAGGIAGSSSGTDSANGGGGGGSGGAILVESAALTLNGAELTANGGGGGGGGDQNGAAPTNGFNGTDVNATPANGGTEGGAQGGNGGAGAAGATAPGAGQSDNDSGGGGGGSVGRVRVNTASCTRTAGTLSPAPTYGGNTCP